MKPEYWEYPRATCKGEADGRMVSYQERARIADFVQELTPHPELLQRTPMSVEMWEGLGYLGPRPGEYCGCGACVRAVRAYYEKRHEARRRLFP